MRVIHAKQLGQVTFPGIPAIAQGNPAGEIMQMAQALQPFADWATNVSVARQAKAQADFHNQLCAQINWDGPGCGAAKTSSTTDGTTTGSTDASTTGTSVTPWYQNTTLWVGVGAVVLVLIIVMTKGGRGNPKENPFFFKSQRKKRSKSKWPKGVSRVWYDPKTGLMSSHAMPGYKKMKSTREFRHIRVT